jgi:hypothetical protein
METRPRKDDMDFIYTDGSMKGGSSPLKAAATHPATDTRVEIMATSIQLTLTHH